MTLQTTFNIIATPILLFCYYVLIKDLLDTHYPTTNSVDWKSLAFKLGDK